MVLQMFMRLCRIPLNYRETLHEVINSALLENDSIFIQLGTYRLGTSYTSPVRNFRLADSLLTVSLKIALIKNDTLRISLSYANMGWNFYLEKKYKSAIESYNKSLGYSIPGRRPTVSDNSYGNLGTIYRDLGETEKSLKYYQKSISVAQDVGDIYNLSWVYKDLSDLYLRKRDTSNAYINYVLYKKYNDEYITKRNSQGIIDARIKFDADTHKKEMELLSLRVKNQRLLIYGFTGFIILSILIGISAAGSCKNKCKKTSQ